MKNKFERLELSPITLTLETALLAGSVTKKKIAAQGVTVEDYTFGFAEDGNTDDAGFDVNFDN